MSVAATWGGGSRGLGAQLVTRNATSPSREAVTTSPQRSRDRYDSLRSTLA
jgi:hypothetical protein